MKNIGKIDEDHVKYLDRKSNIPKEKFLMLGDNRASSNNVSAKAQFIIYSLNRIR